MENILYPNLFSPVKIGKHTIPNRIIMGAMHTHLEETSGSIEKLKAYYLERVRGGVGLIITGGIGTNLGSSLVEGGALLNSPKEVKQHQELTSAVHKADGKICLQILHGGRYSVGDHTVAPSAIKSPTNSILPKALTEEDIKKEIIDFVRCATLAKSSGYDGIELMGAEGYLLNEFIVKHTNQRNDQWGGSYANRIKIVITILKMIRKATGPDFLIIYRLSMLDLIENGSTFEEVVTLAQAVEKAGADVINTGIGWHESRIPTIASMVPRGGFSWVTERIKGSVNIPLITSNRINTPEKAEEILARGDADLISMARPFLADPEFILKAKQNRSTDINTCIGCNQACLDHVLFLKVASCMVNPRACNETSLNYLPTSTPKKIAVIGAGPAGLTVATIAAKRGHSVTLFEAKESIGGQFNFAKIIPGKEEYSETIRYFTQEILNTGVELKTNREVSADELIKSGFQETILATGVKPKMPTIPGIHLPLVKNYLDVLQGAEVGRRVVFIGAGGIAFDLAELLTHSKEDESYQNVEEFCLKWGIDMSLRTAGGIAQQPNTTTASREITLLQRSNAKFGHSLGMSTGWIHLRNLEQKGVKMLSGVEYLNISDNGVAIRVNSAEKIVPADTVVICAGQLPNQELANNLQRKGIKVRLVGGALSTKQLDAKRAINEAAHLAAQL